MGSGGYCSCQNATAWREGEWKAPTCEKGECYAGQDYKRCEVKEGLEMLDDGTFCYYYQRWTECLRYSGVYL